MPKFNTYQNTSASSGGDTLLSFQQGTGKVKQIYRAVSSIAALKAIDTSVVPNGATIEVLGYYLAGDGGCGDFIFSSGSVSADNSGTIIAPTSGSGRWLRNYSGALNVRWFGAKGDGVTDDYASINSTLAALPQSGGDIIFPPATYLFSNTITVTKLSVRFLGQGGGSASSASLGSTILKKSGVLSGAGFSLENHRGAIENITIDGAAGNGGDGVVILGNNCAIRNVSVFRQGRDGIRIGSDGAGYNSNAWSLNNVVVMSNVAHGLNISDVGRNANAGLASNLSASSNGGDGIHLNVCSHNTFVNTLCETNTGYGIRLTGEADNNYFIGGDVDEANTAGNVLMETGAADNAFCFMSAAANFTDNGTRTRLDIPDDGPSAQGFNQLFNKLRISHRGTAGTPERVGLELQNPNEVDAGHAIILMFTGSETSGNGRAGIAFERDGSGGVGKLHILKRETADATPLSLSDSVWAWENTYAWCKNRLLLNKVALTYGVTIALNAALGQIFTITVTDGVAYTLSTATNPADGQIITVRVRNTSGGAAGVMTWGANYQLAGAWTQPATSTSRIITFYFDQTNGKWFELNRSAADIPD